MLFVRITFFHWCVWTVLEVGLPIFVFLVNFRKIDKNVTKRVVVIPLTYFFVSKGVNCSILQCAENEVCVNRSGLFYCNSSSTYSDDDLSKLLGLKGAMVPFWRFQCIKKLKFMLGLFTTFSFLCIWHCIFAYVKV